MFPQHGAVDAGFDAKEDDVGALYSEDIGVDEDSHKREGGKFVGESVEA